MSGVKHAGAETIQRLAGLLTELRQRPLLKEKTPGAFYVKSKAFLHFHEDAEEDRQVPCGMTSRVARIL
jgi:hypothetical protein